MESLGIEEFMHLPGTVLDVRSPGEFLQGHIPGAKNFPLFSNEERALVGTVYKQEGKDKAIELGLQLVGPKLHDLVRQAKQLVGQGTAKIHCWRGGMRSSSTAWLLRTAGLSCVTLLQGYKGFRSWVLSSFSKPLQIYLLGGLTGCGKTAILGEFADNEIQVIDLEELANHRGSSYGMLGMGAQPTHEQFENELALKWMGMDSSKPVWMEDESRMIGRCKIPDLVYQQMSLAPVYLVERPKTERISRLLLDYGHIGSENLIEATKRIEKKLGRLRTKQAEQLIRSGQIADAMEIVLGYYDKTYEKGLQDAQRPITSIYGEGLSNQEWAARIIEATATNN